MANTLPTEIASQLIEDTAAQLRCLPEIVQCTLDSFPDRDLSEVLEAMQDLGTSDVGTLSAYLTGASVLDDSLDGWLMEVA